MRAGVRYARSSPPFKATLAARGRVFAVRERVLGVAAAHRARAARRRRGALRRARHLHRRRRRRGRAVLPRLRRRYGASRLVVAQLARHGAVLVLRSRSCASLPSWPEPASLAGATWIAALSSFNVSAQMSLPDWVRARGLAIYNAVFFGSLALGSALWGQRSRSSRYSRGALDRGRRRIDWRRARGARAAAGGGRARSDAVGALAAAGGAGRSSTTRARSWLRSNTASIRAAQPSS